MWFFGFLFKSFAAPLLERFGHLTVLKRVLIPLNIISFQLQMFSNSYFLICLGYLVTGLTKLKMIPLQTILRESVEVKHSAAAVTFLYMFVFTIIVVFCVYIEYVSKNAIWFLHYTNGISIFAGVLFCAISVESPLR